MVEAKIQREELNGNNRILVLSMSGEDWEGDDVERINVPVEASKKQVKKSIQTFLNQYKIGKETENRIQELKDIGGDPVGMTVSDSVDAGKVIDERVELEELKQKAEQKSQSLTSTEKNRLNELLQKENLAPAEENELESLMEKKTGLPRSERERRNEIEDKFSRGHHVHPDK